MIERIFHMLGFEIRVATNCSDLGGRLGDIAVNAEQDSLYSGTISFQVFGDGDNHRILTGSQQAVIPRKTERSLPYLHEWINHCVFGRISDVVRIHAGCAGLNGKRIIFVGDKGSGKTTLLCRLLHRGFDVHGDEFVLLLDELTVPFPRKFHLKEGALACVPELAPVWERLSPYPSYFGGRFCFFDPSDEGFPWTVRKKKCDIVCCLEPNHHAQTRLEPCPKYLMAQKVMQRIDNFSLDPRLQIKQLCNILAKTDCYTLYLGDLESAAALMCGLMG